MTVQYAGCTLDYVYRFLDNVKFACAVFDEEENLLWWNQAATDLTGYPSLGLCESDVLGLFKDPVNPENSREFELEHATGHDDMGYAMIQCKDGQLKKVRLHQVPLGNESDEIPSVALMFVQEN